MDDDKRIFLEGMYPYFKILSSVNENLLKLSTQNIGKEPYENEELFYVIVTDLIRLFPVKIPKEQQEANYDCAHVDEKSGIMLLKKYIPFLKENFYRLIKNKKCIKALDAILMVRNKYIHEPHNMHFGYSVGGNTSCSMGLYYKDKLLPISTIWLANIVYELNSIFLKIQELYSCELNKYDDKYKDYYFCKYVCDLPIKEYNVKLNIIPWQYIEFNDEIETAFN